MCKWASEWDWFNVTACHGHVCSVSFRMYTHFVYLVFPLSLSLSPRSCIFLFLAVVFLLHANLNVSREYSCVVVVCVSCLQLVGTVDSISTMSCWTRDWRFARSATLLADDAAPRRAVSSAMIILYVCRASFSSRFFFLLPPLLVNVRPFSFHSFSFSAMDLVSPRSVIRARVPCSHAGDTPLHFVYI